MPLLVGEQDVELGDEVVGGSPLARASADARPKAGDALAQVVPLLGHAPQPAVQAWLALGA
jgi:hypothetical protein